MDRKIRCDWCGRDPLYVAYHDNEWGVPLHDDRRLFEMLVLEGAQAGLSWLMILRKREEYRRAFHGFDVERVAGADEMLADRNGGAVHELERHGLRSMLISAVECAANQSRLLSGEYVSKTQPGQS